MRIEIVSWGLSMYGGYYIEYRANGKYNGVRATTLRECLEMLEISRRELKPCKRFDN